MCLLGRSDIIANSPWSTTIDRLETTGAERRRPPIPWRIPDPRPRSCREL